MKIDETTQRLRDERDKRVEILEDIYTTELTMRGVIDYLNEHNNMNDGYEYHFCIQLYALIRFPRGLEFPYCYG